MADDVATSNTQLAGRLQTVEGTLESQGKILTTLTAGQRQQGEAIASLASSLGGVSTSVQDIVHKIDSMGGEVSGQSATRGMIEGKTILAAVSAMIALVAVGMTLLSSVKKELQDDIMIADRISNLRHDAQSGEITNAEQERTDMANKEIRFLLDQWMPHLAEQERTLARIDAETKENAHELDVKWRLTFPFIEEWGAGKSDIRNNANAAETNSQWIRDAEGRLSSLEAITN